MTDLPLPLTIPSQPELPDPDGLPHDGKGNILGGESKWTSWRAAHRPCDWCVLIIHQGKHNGHPRAASQKRTGPNGIAALCNEHGERQKRRDDAVARHLAGIRSSQKKTKR